MANVGGASGGVGGVASAAGSLVNGGSVVQSAPDSTQHHQPFDVQVTTFILVRTTATRPQNIT